MILKRISISILFRLLYSEQKMDFNWYINIFKKAQQYYSIPEPKIFIINFDKQLYKVIKTFYPKVQLQLYIFYINDNIKFAIIYKWIKRYIQLYLDIKNEITEIVGTIETAETADLEELKTKNKKSNKQSTSFPINIVITKTNLFHI